MRVLVAAVAVALLGCGASDDDVAPSGPTVPVRFSLASEIPAPGEVPFPSDLYLDPDTGLVIPSLGSWENFGITSGGDTIDGAFAGLDGFGRSVGALFLVDSDAAIDPTTLVAGVTFAIVDLDAGSPVASMAGYTEGPRTIAVHPDRTVLEAGRRYAAFVTTGVRTVNGESLAASEDLVRLIHERTSRAQELYGGAIDIIAAAGFGAESIAGLAVFTSQSRHRLLRRMRDALVAGDFGPEPQIELTTAIEWPVARFGSTAHPGWTATLDEWLGDAPKAQDGTDLPGFADLEIDPVGTGHDAIGAVLSGSFVAPEFRRPFASTAAPDDGTFEVANGMPIVADADARVPVTLVLPRSPAPPSGYPVVLFGHGTPTHRSYAMSVANELARAGIAVLAIDAPEHGMRTPDAKDGGNAFTGPYDGPDAMADEISSLASTVAAFGDFVNVARARDTRAQTIIDYCQARRLAANPNLDLSAAADEYGGVAPKLDGDRIGWVGVSFGGINGMVLAAVEPEIDALLLNVGGGAEYMTFGESPANLPQLDLVLPAYFGLPRSNEVRMSRFNPALAVIQMMMDSVDPASFAAEVGQAHLYAIEVHFDEYVPNYGTELVARLMHLPQIAGSPVVVEGLDTVDAPVSGNAQGITRALLVQPLGTHGRNLTSRRGDRVAQTPFPREDQPIEERIVYLPNPVTVRQPVVATQRSMVTFFETAWTTPVIDVTGMAMWIDFDDDGWTDAEETAASTDPFDPASHPSGEPPHPWNAGF